MRISFSDIAVYYTSMGGRLIHPERVPVLMSNILWKWRGWTPAERLQGARSSDTDVILMNVWYLNSARGHGMLSSSPHVSFHSPLQQWLDMILLRLLNSLSLKEPNNKFNSKVLFSYSDSAYDFEPIPSYHCCSALFFVILYPTNVCLIFDFLPGNVGRVPPASCVRV